MDDQDRNGAQGDPSDVDHSVAFSGQTGDLSAYKAALDLFMGTFHQAEVGLLHMQADGRVSLHNQCALRILGYTSESLLRQSFYDLVYADERHWIEEQQRQLLAGDVERYSCECRLRHQDGHYLWVYITVGLQRDPIARWPHSIVTVFDISERKLAEEKYQRAKQELHINFAQLEAIIGHLPQALLLFSETGELRRANPAAIEMQAQRMLTPPSGPAAKAGLRLRNAEGQEIEAGQWPLEKALRQEEVSDFMCELVELGFPPTSSWYCFNAAPVFGRNGQLLTIIMTVHDITAMKRIELALRESELSYRQLADSMPHIVWVCDTAGTPQLFNKRWYEFISDSPRHPGDQPQWDAIIHPDDLALMRERYWKAIEYGKPLEVEIRMKNRRTAAYEWHLVKALPARNEQGQITRWYGSSTHIHHQKMVEEKLRKADKAKDEFFAVLSHELRSPLNVILGYSDLIKRRDSVPINLNEAIEAIERNAHAQAQLVGDLLEISKIISGKMPFERQRFDPRHMIQDAFESVRFAASAKQIELKVEIEPLVQELVADPHRMRQILWNLLSNAIKFTPERGSVSLTARTQGAWYEIRIQDTGVGLPAEALAHVFDRFWQEDTLETHRQFGLGLGLSIVHHLTEIQGGRVWAESEGRGLGSTFVVSLPLGSREDAVQGVQALRPPKEVKFTESASPSKHSSLHEGRDLAGRRILVVDDQDDSVRLLERILSDLDAEVHCAASGAEALKIFMTQKFDLILSDIAMPEMDGLDLIRGIRAWEADFLQQPTPAIALATYVGELSESQAVEAGFQRHLTKPVYRRVLVHEVLKVLGESEDRTATPRLVVEGLSSAPESSVLEPSCNP